MDNKFVKECSLDQVELQFDWVAATDGRTMFSLGVASSEQNSRVDLEIDLLKLTPVELCRLEDFLVRRHAGLTSSTEVAVTAAWLLDSSLQQSQTLLKYYERQALVRTLLLAQGAGHRGTYGRE